MKTFTKIKSTAKTIFWAGVFILAIVGVITCWDIVGRWLAFLGGGIITLFGGMKAIGQKGLEQIRKRNQEIRENIENQKELRTRLDSKVESWHEKVKKLRQGTLILVVCTGLCLGPSVARAEVYIPEDYDELKALYLEALALLDEADKLIIEYQSLVADQTQTTEEQASIIDELERDIFKLSQPAWGLTGGVELDDSAQWMIGLSRRYKSTSWTIGFTGSDEFRVFGMYSLWLQNPF